MKKITIVSALVLLFGCASPSGPLSSGAAVSSLRQVTLLFTEARKAELEPCGCSFNPHGGFVREANQLGKWKNTLAKRVLSLTAGQAFLPADVSSPAQVKEHHRQKAKFVVEGLNRVGLNVLSPSATDLSLGLTSLRSLLTNAKFKIVSANLLLHSDQKPLFEEYAEFDIEGQKVIVTGVTKFNSAKVPGLGQNVVVAPASDRLALVLNKVPKESFVILLSDLPRAERDELLKKFPQVRIALGANDETTSRRSDQLGKELIGLNVLDRAREIVRVDVEVGPPGKPFFNPEYSQMVSEERAWRTARIAEIKKKLDAEKDPTARAELEASVLNLQSYLDFTQEVPLSKPSQALPFTSEFVFLDKSLDTPLNELSEVVEQYRKSTRNAAVGEIGAK